jgi:two-component system, OmpR family, response regulator MprA
VRILVVEDDAAVRDSLARTLRFEGHEVDTAADGRAALDAVRAGEPDAMVLDVSMPRMDGLQACRRLRAEGFVLPVLMLTARDSVGDRVAGLDAGADDYLVKPFALVELLARLRALLRRSTRSGPAPMAAPVSAGSASGAASVSGGPVSISGEPAAVSGGPASVSGGPASGGASSAIAGSGPGASAAGEWLAFADVRLDPVTHEAWRGERALRLTRTEFAILEAFLRRPRQVLTRATLFEEVWGYDFGEASNSIHVYLGYLRRKLEADGEPRLLHTVRGVGFALREDPL